MKNRHCIYLLALGLTFTHAASAATQTWQTANANNTWDLTATNWDAGVVWTNGNNALFTGTTETVTLGAAALNAGTVSFDGTGQWTLNGPAASLTASAININTTAGGKLSLATTGTLSNVAAINVTTGSTLFAPSTLINSAITVGGTGNTENRGALRLETGAILSGTITLNADTTIGTSDNATISSTVSGNFSLSRASVGTGTLTLSGPLTFTGGFTQAIAGTTVLSGTSTYAGATTISAGSLTLSGSIANSALSLSDGTTLRGEGTAASATFGTTTGATLVVDPTTPAALTVNGALAVNGAVNVSLTTPIAAGSGPVTLLNYGTTTATAANFSVGTGFRNPTPVVVGGGSVTLDPGNKNLVWTGATTTWELGGTDGDWNSGADQFFNGDYLTFNDTGANPSITLAGTFAPSSITVNSTTNNYSFLGGGFSGSTGLTKSGSSTLTLTGNNSNTGAISLTGGTLALDNTASTGAQNQFTGTTGGIAVGASTTLRVKVAGTGVDGTAYVLSRSLSGSGTLALENAGATGTREISLSGTNTGFAGAVNITRSSGTQVMRVKANQMANATQISVADGGQFWDNTASGQTVGYTFTNLAGPGEGGFGALRVAGGVTYSGAMTMNASGGRIGGAGGAGLIATLSGQISGGLLELLGTSNGITLLVTNNSNTPSAATIMGGSSGAVRAAGNTVFGSGTLTQNGATLMSSNTTARTFANPYVVGGNITLGDATNNGKLTFTGTTGFGTGTRTVTTASEAELSGTLSNGGLTHAGAGKLTLSGTGSTLTSVQQTGAGNLEIPGAITLSGAGSQFSTSALAGTSTVNIGGSLVYNGGSGFNVIIGQNTANHNGVLNVSGSYTQNAESIFLGNNVATVTGTINVNSGGTVTFGTGMANSSASGTGGAAGVVLGRDGGIGTINLATGGTLASAKDIIRGTGTGTFNFNGGTLKALATRATFLQGLTAANINTGGAIIDSNGFDITIGQALLAGTGGAGLVKNGAGKLTLTGANTYTGDTTANGGTLSLGTASLADAAKVNLNNGAVLDLTFAGSDTVDQLIIDGVQQTTGTWGSSASTATHQDDVHFSGTGTLTVVTGPANAYAGWAATKGLTVANNGKNQDPDNDGRNNLHEFGFGGDPLSGATGQRIVARRATVNTFQMLTLTVPVRNGAVFSGSPDLTATVDGIIYHIQASLDLADWTSIPAAEVPVGDRQPLIDAATPAPTGYTNRFFYVPDSQENSKVFLRAKVEEAP
ncbi:autotransporter-associated beta strand repeat-containing protein [Luteolibacter ambystomatis]|uniref:Autotransporter-associated beta strand repeat-containing protein n=1 Tax=Luteolibacter ambystomatis TaxID=2824561 RepID=A0A975G863_9BACT|nr:autotransporter-associated beta strand repeat-containing protein [Luteolibacter ambystomatis]QUE51124.1 autotransporter-associated beta strand repeat-containing protein [Luteolibacter ambystomatis]